MFRRSKTTLLGWPPVGVAAGLDGNPVAETIRPWTAPFEFRADSEIPLHLAWLVFLAGFGAQLASGMEIESGAAVFASLGLAWSAPLLWGPAGCRAVSQPFPRWSGTGYLAVAACLVGHSLS